jgi:hypothetical protein
MSTIPNTAGFDMSLGNLSLLSHAKTRSISAENRKGEKGRGGMAAVDPNGPAREFGIGWKTSPCVDIQAGELYEVANIQGPGLIQQIWMTPNGVQRHAILRIYWDNSEFPSVESPIGDFFGNGWGYFSPIASLAVCANPKNGYNSYWPMPFRKHCRITVENIGFDKLTLFYQVNYSLQEVPAETAYFHAQFRRTNPLPDKADYTILDDVEGWGHYVGTAMSWGTHNSGWWGEGEIKFFLDGDKEFSTICGTGTEDYFGGAWGFELGHESGQVRYSSYTTPYSGFYSVPTTNFNHVLPRFSLYRWHIMDPVRFEENLRVTIQSIGWRSNGRFLHLKDDIASVAYWYQSFPFKPFPKLPSRNELEVI